ncbi:hypothetical protein [Blastopirellula marina]|uniref:Uncharacterized protein n=1 Tax=Blastopirellula marina TaxID=124 RepID=A0A2S8FLK4_9BACT|nr:hypothetical protein [Blastopirellula marina]PQO33069.1 hypothetical protein C5Y98_18205 [Blastopirellula marina]PTL43236.1 hypothetical protein C5Y97_18215 [Blastopirellula marina]
MNYRLPLFTLSLLLICSSWGVGQEPPTLRELIDGVPILTPKTKSLERFHLKMACRSENSALSQMVEMCWVRDEWSGMFITWSQHGTPLVFTSQGRGFQFDTLGRRVLLHRGDAFMLTGKVHEENFQLGYSVSSEAKKEPVLFDLPSLVKVRSVTAKVDQDEAGDWRVSAISDTGRCRVILVFDRESPYALNRYESYSLISGQRLARLELSLNKNFPNAWPKFPADNEFPAGLEVRKMDLDFEKEDVSGKVTKIMDVMTYMMAQVGIHMKDIRESELMADQDWNAIEATDREFGPKLRRAIGFPPLEVAEQKADAPDGLRR